MTPLMSMVALRRGGCHSHRVPPRYRGLQPPAAVGSALCGQLKVSSRNVQPFDWTSEVKVSPLRGGPVWWSSRYATWGGWWVVVHCRANSAGGVSSPWAEWGGQLAL